MKINTGTPVNISIRLIQVTRVNKSGPSGCQVRKFLRLFGLLKLVGLTIIAGCFCLDLGAGVIVIVELRL